MDEIETYVREMIRASDVPAEIATAVQESLRYSIRLHVTKALDDALTLGVTKIGGQPDLPQDIQWPEWRDAPLNFLAQIRLADVAAYDSDGELPHEGMLSFFFDYQRWFRPEGDAEGSLASVLYFPEGAALQRLRWPETLEVRERYAPLAVTSFTRELTEATYESPIIEQLGYTPELLYLPDEWLPDGMSETAVTARRIEDLMLAIDRFLHNAYDSRGLVHRLLGHADEIQYGVEYDWQRVAAAASGPQFARTLIRATDWRLLLQVDSDENGMTWGDVGRIYYGLPRRALAARDFSQTYAELQCT